MSRFSFIFAILFYGATALAGETIKVEITSHLGDEKEFFKGDEIEFLISISKDAYLLMIYETSDKQLLQIYPNAYTPKKKIAADNFISIPGDDERFRFKISAPFGKERVRVFAAERSFPNLKGKTLSNGVKLLYGKTKFTLRRIRAMGKFGAYGEGIYELSTKASP